VRSGSPIPLETDGSGRFLPWLIALMAFLATLAIGVAFAVGGALDRWDAGLAGTLTVELPAADASGDKLGQALALLRGTPGVTAADPLDTDETGRLLKPWLGDGVDPATLKLPVLVDVRLAPEATPDRAGLEAQLGQIVPGASVERRGAWLDRLFETARLIEIGAAALVVLVGAVAVAAVVFTTRTGLALHAEIIGLLHLIGATDRYVARLFQWHAFRLALRGGIIGLILEFLAFGAFRLAAEAHPAGGLDALAGLRPPLVAWVLMIVLPLVLALVGLVTARITVLRTLARMP
jgi:cell division transport system permease protein